RRDYERLEEMGEHNYLATTAAFLAQTLAAQGRPDEAERFIEVSREAAGGEDLSAQMVWQGLRARVRGGRGGRGGAQTCPPGWSGGASGPGSWPPADSSRRPRRWPARRSRWRPGPTSSTSTPTPCSSWPSCSTAGGGRPKCGPRSARRSTSTSARATWSMPLARISGWNGSPVHDRLLAAKPSS